MTIVLLALITIHLLALAPVPQAAEAARPEWDDPAVLQIGAEPPRR
jgi:hypothetical protein